MIPEKKELNNHITNFININNINNLLKKEEKNDECNDLYCMNDKTLIFADDNFNKINKINKIIDIYIYI